MKLKGKEWGKKYPPVLRCPKKPKKPRLNRV